jgi:hypothetical protein
MPYPYKEYRTVDDYFVDYHSPTQDTKDNIINKLKKLKIDKGMYMVNNHSLIDEIIELIQK